jgi:hypothetical protein
MKISTKAVLLSALVLPGAGHIYLKKYIPGLALITVSIASLYYLIASATKQALQIVEQIQNGDVPLDATTITDLASMPPAGTEYLLQNMATAVIIICWVIGIIDAYRIGGKRDRENK